MCKGSVTNSKASLEHILAHIIKSLNIIDSWTTKGNCEFARTEFWLMRKLLKYFNLVKALTPMAQFKAVNNKIVKDSID